MKKSDLLRIIKEEVEKKFINESLQLDPKEKKLLTYILEMKIQNDYSGKERFFADEIEIVTNILNKL